MTGMIEELDRRIAELERRISILEDPARPRPFITDHDSCGQCLGSCSKAEKSSGGLGPAYEYDGDTGNCEQSRQPDHRRPI